MLVAGTGYQYGDTDFLEYSERLYRDFTEELRAGPAGSTVSLGEALMNAKRTYLATTPDIRGIHEKALLEATLFGLPMFGVNMPAGRGGNPGGSSPPTITPTAVASGPAAQLGLAVHDLTVATPFTEPPPLELDVVDSSGVSGTVTARWLAGPDGVVTNPAEPAIPKHVVNATSTVASHVLRGVGFRGGTFTDEAPIIPLTGAPTTELRGVHAPFVSPVFYPMRMWTPNYFGALDGTGGTNLIVTPVQHRSDPATLNATIRRVFQGLDLRLFYMDGSTLTTNPAQADAALSDAPTIVSVETAVDGSDLVFRAQVVGDPSAAVHEVWTVWTDGDEAWVPLDLQQCTAPLPASCEGLDDSRVWTARLSGAPANLKYVVQAANGAGLVAFDDNRGSYYTASTGATAAPAATTLELIDPPEGGIFGSTVNVTAELKSGGIGLANQQVLIQIGGAGAFGITGPDGRATVPIALNTAPPSTMPAATTLTASFGATEAFVGSSDAASFVLGRAPTSLSAITPFVTTTDDLGGVLTTLTATLGATDQPLMNRTVTVTVDGPVTRTLSLITDYLGRVRLPLDLPAGTYAVVVSFAGDETYEPTDASDDTAIIAFAFRAPVDNEPTVNTVKAGSTVPIKFSLGGNHGLGVLAGTPLAVKYDCESGVATDEVELTTTSNSGLTFTGGLYQYNWKTPKAARGCYRFELVLDDGTTHFALFKLR